MSMDGAKSGVYVYINGKEVGYSEDSKQLPNSGSILMYIPLQKFTRV
jgi:hypothetical protein